MAEDVMHAPERWIELPHGRLPYWRLGGPGPDLVFVHGWPLDARTWRRCVAALRDGYTCHLIDLPGAGRSQWGSDGPMGVGPLAGVLLEAIEAMELSGPSLGLVGHDSGGTFARLAAAELGPRIHGLVLGNTEIPDHHPWRLRALLRAVRSNALGPLWPRLLNSRWGQEGALRDSFGDTGWPGRGEFVELFLEPLWSSRGVFDEAMRLARHIEVEDFDVLAEAHPRIEAPVKLVWGEDDPWFPLGKCRPMCETFGGEVDLVVVEGAKLFVHEEYPERFAREVRAHFDAHLAGPLQAS